MISQTEDRFVLPVSLFVVSHACLQFVLRHPGLRFRRRA